MRVTLNPMMGAPRRGGEGVQKACEGSEYLLTHLLLSGANPAAGWAGTDASVDGAGSPPAHLMPFSKSSSFRDLPYLGFCFCFCFAIAAAKQ